MKEEIMGHIKNLKPQGINIMDDEDQINDLVNKISDKKDERNRFIDFEIYRFLNEYGSKNIYVRYNKNKNKFNTEEITRSLKRLSNKLIDFREFNEEYDKSMDDVIKLENYKFEKEPGSVSSNQKK